jgi:hypothetical protein
MAQSTFDFSSWQGLLSTLLGVALFSLIVVGIRLLIMHTVQLRRERENRQINERLRTLIGAYKVLGGSFTGSLAVDPAHLRDQRIRSEEENDPPEGSLATSVAHLSDVGHERPGAERRRRIRDAVEAALSEVILLGTEEQVRLAATAANDLVAGRSVETAALVVSLRNFIREVLDLEAVPAEVAIPKQGPTRPSTGVGRGGRDERGAGAARRGGGGQGGGAGMAGVGLGAARARESDDGDPGSRS